MKTIKLNDIDYEIQTNYRDALNEEELQEKFTDYFYEFDYIVGDYAYSKLRLKGFNDSNSKKCNKINDIKNLDKYLENNCAYGCKYFVLKRVKEK